MSKDIYMIGNAHLDPVWLWQWQEGFAENKATMKSALDRMDEYDDFIFTSSSAQFYEWIENNDPEMFEKIKQRIKEGRWILCGGWWIQPDCNIPSGESFARQGLIAQNYFMDKFGIIARVAYNVDSFGHNGMLPQIFNLSGMDRYVFMRPGPHEKDLPDNNRVFIWQSPDGSRVTTFRIAHSYERFGDIQGQIERCASENTDPFNGMMAFYGVGNHGGGPTIENIKEIHALAKDKENGYNIFLSSPNKFFDDLEYLTDSFPVVTEDLQHHASGCYSAVSEVKALNRKSENALVHAEILSVLANILRDNPYPNNFNTAWKSVLFNQFHDILAGSSIEKAYTDARYSYGEAITIAQRNTNYAQQAISFAINIDFDPTKMPIVVFNPHSWEVNAKVEVQTGLFSNGILADDIEVLDCNGSVVAHQSIAPDAIVPNRKRIIFKGKVPAMGYSVFMVSPASKKVEVLANNDENILENDLVKVAICKKTGAILSIFDKQENCQVLANISAYARVIDDKSDTWSHNVFTFDNYIGDFTPISIKKIENGNFRSSIRVISKYKNSTMVQIFTLYADGKEVYVKTKLNWQEKLKCLKIQFTPSIIDTSLNYEMPFGYIEKVQDGQEEPMQSWVDLSGKLSNGSAYGVSIINESKYGASVKDNTISLTALRSPVYAHHDPKVLEDELDIYSFTDQGIQEFSYIIYPHKGDFRQAETNKMARELNMPCGVILETFHKGKLPQNYSFIDIDKKNIIVSALKRSEKDEDTILRVYETDGVDTKVKISLPSLGRSFDAEISHNKIVTFKIPKDPKGDVKIVNLLEWEI